MKKVEDMLEKAKEDLSHESMIIGKFMEDPSFTQDCDYYRYHTSMYNYHRGQVNALIDVLNIMDKLSIY